jgi:C-terminal processing protease CtpA/Prc
MPARRPLIALSTVSDSAGIGIFQMATEQGIKIVGVFDGSPADAASIEEGDLLVSANGTGIDESNYQDVSSILGDEAGTRDTLEISDPESNSREKVILKGSGSTRSGSGCLNSVVLGSPVRPVR